MLPLTESVNNGLQGTRHFGANCVKRTKLLILLLLLSVPTLGTLIRPTEGQSIGSVNLTGGRSVFDSYYGDSVRAYTAGISTVTLRVQVYSGNAPLNVSAVKVLMDWGVNYTSTEGMSVSTPTVVFPNQYRYFTVQFLAPDTSQASNLVTHTYTAIVEHVRGPGGPLRGTLTYNYYGLAVYSAAQDQFWQLRDKHNSYQLGDGYGQGAQGVQSTEAYVLYYRARVLANDAYYAYQAGQFDAAVNMMTEAISMADRALSVASSQGFAQELSSSLAGWGQLLLGVGAIGIMLAGFFILRRLKLARPMVSAAETRPSAS